MTTVPINSDNERYITFAVGNRVTYHLMQDTLYTSCKLPLKHPGYYPRFHQDPPCGMRPCRNCRRSRDGKEPILVVNTQ